MMTSVWCIFSIVEIDMTRHTQQCVEKEKDDDDYTLYHHKTHTHTKQTDAKRRGEKNQENQTHIGHEKKETPATARQKESERKNIE